jgi:hypothetical protein
VVGGEKQEGGKRLHAVIMWRGFAMSLFSPLPFFVLFLLVPFCICLGGSWSVLLIDSIFLWHLSSDWLKDLEGEKL